MEYLDQKKVIVFTSTGQELTLAEWQDYYGLPVGTDKVGHYFSVSGDRVLEKNLLQNGELIICGPLMKIADEVRRLWGKPLRILDFNRSEAKQKWLIDNGYPAGKRSTHTVMMALDLDTRTNAESRTLGRVVLQASQNTGIPVRLGVQKYINHPFTLVHVDVAPVFYAPSGVYHSKDHPKAWEKEVRF